MNMNLNSRAYVEEARAASLQQRGGRQAEHADERVDGRMCTYKQDEQIENHGMT